MNQANCKVDARLMRRCVSGASEEGGGAILGRWLSEVEDEDWVWQWEKRSRV